MPSLTERLRGIVKPAASLHDRGTHSEDGSAAAMADGLESRAGDGGHAAADVLGGVWCDTTGHPFMVVDRTYSPGYRHGRVAIADAAPPTEGWGRMHFLMRATPENRDTGNEGARMDPHRCLFLDLETTGLAGGAGTYAFLVGLAWFDGCTFRVRQFFLASYAAERALLQAVRDVATRNGIVVTYNAVETGWTLSVSNKGRGKQMRASNAEGGLGTGIIAALARQLDAQVVTESRAQGTSVSVAHRAAKTV